MIEQTIPEGAVWGIFILPLAALLLIIFSPHWKALPGVIAALAMGAALALSLWALDSVDQANGGRIVFPLHEWLHVGPVNIDAGINLDGLTAIMLVVVTSVSFLVQVYSMAYMAGDGGYWRYFSYMCLFTASMIGLVLFDSLIFVYAFWELVGLSSFLLIGFWFDRPAAAAAAKKAFLVTRMGDLGFLLAIILIFSEIGTFDIPTILDYARGGAIDETVLTLFALGIFAGAAGKSAQFPLHVWLPDAMEGPTPVSALIHAATMVAAGVYLVARMFPVFDYAPDAMAVVGAIGGITALMAALIALVMTDIKRVLAYSTISQLGYMMLALGTGAYVAAMFHLFTHAFFKALLFLGSGSVNHATGTFDMRLMGGLARSMPLTFLTFLIGSLSLAGIFPLAGFWSKDEILAHAWDHERYLFYIALLSAGLTAFYMTRVIILTFLGSYRGGDPTALHVPVVHAPTVAEESAEGHEASEHAPPRPHESPLLMTLPLLLLAIPAVIAGFANQNHDFERLLVGALPLDYHVDETHFYMNIAVASTIVPVAGIVLAVLIYGVKLLPTATLWRLFRPVGAALENRLYIDAFYEKVIVGYVFFRLLGGILSFVDRFVVDGLVNGIGVVARTAGGGLRALQTGQFQAYGAVAFAGVVFTLALVLALNPL